MVGYARKELVFERGDFLKKYVPDILLGIGLAAFSVFYFYMSIGIEVFAGYGATKINSQTIPQIYSAILLFLSLSLLTRTARRIYADKKAGTFCKSKQRISVRNFLAEYYAVIATFLCMFAFAFALKTVGFLISAFLYLIVQILVLTPKGKITWKVVVLAVLIALISSILIDWLFVTQFSVLLPAGILGF